MKRFWVFVIVPFLILTSFYCESSKEEEPPPDNPVPTLTSISPTSKVSHLPTFTLTATGTNFVSSSEIVFGGSEKQTTYVSATELTCEIDPADITASAFVSSMSQEGTGFSEILSSTVAVLVRNPTPGGGDSNSVSFTINDNFTFYVPKNISNSADGSNDPNIAVGSIFVVWEAVTSTGFDEIYFSHSDDGGATWSTPVNISNTPTDDSDNPVIAVDSSGNINVAWDEWTSSDSNIYFSRSTNDGGQWSARVNISNTSDYSYDPEISVDSSGNIVAVWEEEVGGGPAEVNFSRSTNGGGLWSTRINISNTPPSDWSSDPDIVIDSSGNINVVWEEFTSSDDEIYFSRSTNDGANWSAAVNVSNNATGSTDPEIAVDSSGNINVIWEDEANSAGDDEIYFSRSTNAGGMWSAAVNVSNTLTDQSLDPHLVMDSAGNINVVWDEDLEPDNIYFSRSINDGANWSAAVNISNTSDDSDHPRIILDSAGNVYIVWEEELTGPDQTYFVSSTH